MTCFIIDDDETTRMLLKDLLSKINSIEVIGEYNNPMEAMDDVVSIEPDILFLDVEMPGINGVEFANSLSVKSKIIFISSKKEYAVDAYGLDAVDYILKPVTLPRLTKAVLKLQKENKPQENEHFFIKTGDGYSKVKIADILYLEALGDYVQIFTENEKFIMNGTLKTALSKLPAKSFGRVHRSYIINFNRIDKIEDGTVIINSKLVPVGRSHKKEFSSRINTLDL